MTTEHLSPRPRPAPTPRGGGRPGRARTGAVLLCAAAALALVTGCGAGGADGSHGSRTPAADGVVLPAEAAHVHGVAADPGTGEVLVATHDGLFRLPAPEEGTGEGAEPEKVGPTIDLMGFSVTDTGRLLASGHPGPGTDLPNPVGLIESLDGGASWSPLSREGESDFHSLAVGGERVVGFDGRLLATENGTDWEELDPSVEPLSLAVSDDGATVVATTGQGLRRSTDGGASFAPVADAPPLVLVAWAAGTDSLYGLTSGGEVHRSEDAGVAWARTGAVGGEPQALHADADQLVVVADHRVSRSTDAGATFRGW
ncbi:MULTISPECIES: F510_1955 family glycosylhydrolase [unclassified Nocardiopsis]|uniref:F510_1955 family glycosylhydrolase n=1 Tax=unclassified Nocardiopsis TaxID=2649073 RepID=UPI001F39747A|nr:MULTISPECIES: hypothetical protein [unclassified Nocardiopsis]